MKLLFFISVPQFLALPLTLPLARLGDGVGDCVGVVSASDSLSQGTVVPCI